MIKLKLTKDKLIAIIQVVDSINTSLTQMLSEINKDMKFARVKSDLSELQDLSRKIRSKLVMMENKPGNSKITFSVNETKAFILMYYKDICTHEPYQNAIIKETSNEIFKKLIA